MLDHFLDPTRRTRSTRPRDEAKCRAPECSLDIPFVLVTSSSASACHDREVG